LNCDILIRGGEVIDPSQGLRGMFDIGICRGQIVALAEELNIEAAHVVSADGMFVTPGLIDLHMHAYTHSPFGLEPDPLCAAGGVTTLLDAGTAGSYNFGAFRRDGIDRCKTDLLGLVNLSCIGLVAANLGELIDRRYADPDGVVETICRHPDVAVGVKIRAGKHIIGEGEQGWANLNDAIRAARDSETWLMVHIGECPMSIPDLCDALSPGDCVTHCFKGGGTRVTDEHGRIYSAVRDAAQRGVIFDVGHGFGSFQWDVVQSALEQGFEPSTISTDLHTKNLHGPVFDMPTTMSKFLMLGVPLERVIEMSTTRPAKVLRRDGDIGTLRVGTVADVAVFEKHDGRFLFNDSYGQHRIGSELLTAFATIRRGELLPGSGSPPSKHSACR
jgi:dihydroorotase